MIAIPIALLTLLLLGSLVVAVAPQVDSWREVVWAVAVVAGAIAFASAVVGLIYWIEAWS